MTGQEPYLRDQAIQAVHGLLRGSGVHQPVADLGHDVSAVQVACLALALLRHELRGHREENRVDASRDPGIRQDHAEKVMRVKAPTLVVAAARY